jgi:hypothetical protein
MEAIRDTKEYLERKRISFKDKTQNLISTDQDTMQAIMEATRLELQSQLEKSWPEPRREDEGRVPAPLRDCRGAQLLNGTGEIHIFDKNHVKPGH